AAVLRLNESITLRRVEPFHGAGSHLGLLVCTNLSRPHDHRAIAHPKSALPMGRHTARCATKQGQAVRSNMRIVRGSRKGFNSATKDKAGPPRTNRAEKPQPRDHHRP